MYVYQSLNYYCEIIIRYIDIIIRYHTVAKTAIGTGTVADPSASGRSSSARRRFSWFSKGLGLGLVRVRVRVRVEFSCIDASPCSACSPQSKPSADVVDIVNRSLVLCLFKMLYHKYIFLDVNSIFDLVQVLLYEGLY